MKRFWRCAMFALVSTAATADGGTVLGLGPADLDRLGVTLQPARPVAEIEVASGPAEVVIPPTQEAIVTSTLSGVLSRVLVAEGDFVTTGAPMAEITSTALLELQREYIEAVLDSELAQAQLERDRTMHTGGIIAERRVLESAARERVALAAADQARQQLMLAGMDGMSLSNLLETRKLDPTLTIRAPFAGFVIEQRSALGAHVDAMDPVYRIADLSQLWLEIHVPQERADRIEAGMRVRASSPDRIVDAVVSSIGRVADAASQTVMVRAGLGNDDLALRVGQMLRASVLDSRIDGEAALVVPSAAIVRLDGTAWVFGNSEGEIAAIPVEILGEDGINTYIRGDFGSRLSVAVDGVAGLKSVWVASESQGE